MLAKDTIILCPTCDREILKIRRDIHDGEIMHGDMVQPIDSNTQTQTGARMLSGCCGSPYFIGGLFVKIKPAQGGLVERASP